MPQVYLCEKCGKQIPGNDTWVVAVNATGSAPEKRMHVQCAEDDWTARHNNPSTPAAPGAPRRKFSLDDKD